MKKKWFNAEIMKNLKIDGFNVGNIRKGEEGLILQKALITSFEDRFYTYTHCLSKIIHLNTCNNLLIVIDTTNTAKIYKDFFPFSQGIRVKRDMKQLMPLSKADIVDITEITFSDSIYDINPKAGEQVIWLFRTGFCFGLYFDLTRKLQPESSRKEMALLYQRVLFFDLYNKVNTNEIELLFKHGWFPFIQLIGDRHNELISFIFDKNPDLIESWCAEKFTNEQIKTITEKWFSNCFFIERIKPIQEGLECFYNNRFAASISTLTPMLEGIANLFLLRTTGKGISYKSTEIIKDIEMISLRKYNEESLFFVKQFKQYLSEYYFKNTTSSESSDAVRNTVAHGRATDKSFTRENALKIIFALDQIYYFI